MAEAKPKRPTPSVTPAPAAARQALMVVGMHRSGTSAAARMLALAGGALPERLMNAGPDNTEGFWEPWEMVALNDRMLAEVGSRWDDVFIHQADAAVWNACQDYLETATTFIAENYGERDFAILKDPRTSATSRFWRAALSDRDLSPVYIIMVRHPSEVARSIAARNGASIAASEMSWTATMAAIERDTRGWPRVFISYNALLTDWRTQLRRIESALARALPSHSAAMEAEIDSFLSGSHRHHKVAPQSADLAPIVEDTWAWMTKACRGSEPSGKAMDTVIARLDELARAVSPALADLRGELADYPALRLRYSDAAAEAAALRLLCDRFHGEADNAAQAADAAEAALASLRSLATETAPVSPPPAFGSRDEALIQAWAEIARGEIRLIRERRLRTELAEADRTVHERRKAEAVQTVTDQLHAEQTAHSITQHGLADAHRHLTLAAEAGATLAAAGNAARLVADAALEREAVALTVIANLEGALNATENTAEWSAAELARARAETDAIRQLLSQAEARAARLEVDLRVARDAERAATHRFAAAAQRLAQVNPDQPVSPDKR